MAHLTHGSCLVLAGCFALSLLSPFVTLASTSVHTTWLWHLHQPIYWPDCRGYGTDHYEAAWDTIQLQDAGRQHPKPGVLRNIFGLDHRVNACQGRPSATLGAISSHLNSGAQVSYSGALMENVQSLGASWSNLPAGLTTAGPLQLWLSCTDAPPPTAAQRFYRARLLPQPPANQAHRK